MSDDDDLGSPASPTPRDSEGPHNERFEWIIARHLPAIRASYGLDCWERELSADLARAMELVEEETEHFTGKLELGAWLLLQARRAVEERVVAQVQRAGRSLGHDYCLNVLTVRTAFYHADYWLTSSSGLRDDLLRDEHLKVAMRTVEAQLADYTGKVALHHWMRRLAHRDDVERGNIQGLDDWLDLIARLAVERYVAEELPRHPDSPLMRRNMVWVAQHVAPYHKAHCGEPTDPRASAEELWSVLLQTVRKPHLHEKIRGHTDEVTMRILKGLPGFKFNSTLDTWRTTVVRHTMYGLLKRKKSDELLALPFSLLAGEDGREIEGYELALADDGLSLQASMERAEQDQQYREIIELAIAQQPDTAAIVRMLLEGLPPRAIAARLPVTAAKVSRDKHAFIRRVRRIWREIGADGIAIGF